MSSARSTPPDVVASVARQSRRQHILEAARALMGAKVSADFDPVRAPICAIDVVMVAGSPWLKDGLERDFAKDENGYRKIGGSSNTPEQAYFFRRGQNLIHYLKRAGFYIPRGGHPAATPGMACFFDWEDRGRYNFTPDRSGIIMETRAGRISRLVVADYADQTTGAEGDTGFIIQAKIVKAGDSVDRALIGYSDLP